MDNTLMDNLRMLRNEATRARIDMGKVIEDYTFVITCLESKNDIESALKSMHIITDAMMKKAETKVMKEWYDEDRKEVCEMMAALDHCFSEIFENDDYDEEDLNDG